MKPKTHYSWVVLAMIAYTIAIYVHAVKGFFYNSPAAPEPAVLMEVSAYCPCERCCGKWADGYTASGHKIQPGNKFVAAPKHIPFGTMLDIPEYGVVPVLDRGGAITVSKLDVFFPSHQEALDWGRKYLEVITHRIRNPPSGGQR